MSLDNVTLRAATLDDLAGIAAIYNQLWCNTLRNRGDVEAADFCARFNIAMQLQRSPIALVAEAEGRIIAACCIGIFEDGKPRTNPTWEPCYNEMFVQATEMAKTADAKLEGSLFGDSREKATADRFAATGNEYAQGQLNLIIIVPEWQGKGLGRALIDLARRTRQSRVHQILPDERLQLRLAVLRAPQHEAHLGGSQPGHRRRIYRLYVRRRHAGLTCMSPHGLSTRRPKPSTKTSQQGALSSAARAFVL